jgi:hypothetical protein
MDRYRGRLPFPVAGPGVPVLPPLPVGNFANIRRGPQPSMEDLNIVNAMMQAAQQRRAQQQTPSANPTIDPNQAVAEMVGLGAFAPPATPVNPAFVYDPNPQRTTVNSALNNYFANIVGAVDKTVREAGTDNISGTAGNILQTAAAPVAPLTEPVDEKAFEVIGELVHTAAGGGEMPEWVNAIPEGPEIWNQIAGRVQNDPGAVEKINTAYDAGGGAAVFEDVVTDTEGMGPVSSMIIEFTGRLLGSPWTYVPILGRAGSAVETSGRLSAIARGGAQAATKGDLAKIGLGKMIRLPNEIIENTADLPFNAIGSLAGKAASRFGPIRRALSPSEQTMRADANAATDDLYDIAARIAPDGPVPPPGAAPPPPTTGGPPPTGPSPAGTAPTGTVGAFTVVKMGPKDFQVIDPATGKPIRTNTGPLSFETHKIAQADATRRNADALPKITDPTTGLPTEGIITRPVDPAATVATAATPEPIITRPEAQTGTTAPTESGNGATFRVPTRKAVLDPNGPETFKGGPYDGQRFRYATEAEQAPPAAAAEPIVPRPEGSPVTPQGILKDHWLNPETGRKVPYVSGSRMPSVSEFVTYELGKRDPAMSDAWWKAVEDDPRTQAFIDEQVSFDRKPSPYGNAPGPLRDSAEKILSQARHEIDVQRDVFYALTDGISPDHAFRHGDRLHPAIEGRVNSGKGGTSYPKMNPSDRGDIERNVVERAIFGSDEEAAAARQYLEIMKNSEASTAAEKARATRMLGEIRDLRAKRLAQDSGEAIDTTPVEAVVSEAVPPDATAVPAGLAIDTPQKKALFDELTRQVKQAEDLERTLAASASPSPADVSLLQRIKTRIAELWAELGQVGAVPKGSQQLWRMMDAVTDRMGVSQADVPDLPDAVPGVMDDTSLGRALNEGTITQEQYDNLNRTITVGGEPIRVYDLIQRKLADFPDDPESARKSLRADIARADGLDTQERGRLLRALDATTATLRENIMYNATNIVRGPIADQASDVISMAVSGNIDAAAASMNLKNVLRRFVRRNADGGVVTDDPRNLRVNAYGESIPPDFLGTTTGRGETALHGEMNVTAGARKLEQKAFGEKAPRVLSRVTPVLASKTGRDIRTAFDGNRRASLFTSVFMREMPEARAALEGYARQRQGEAMGNVIRGLPEDFSPADVLAATGSMDLSRQWRKQVSKAKATAQNEVDRVLFSYKSNNLDSKMKHAIFFHYWMSRSLLLHSRATLQNPGLLNAYLEGLDQLEQKAEEEGLPLNVRTYYKFMGDVGGFYSLIDPVGAVLPYSIFRDMGEENPHGSKFDQIVRKTGIFLNPMVQAAATALGWSEQVPNLTGTGAIQGYAKTVIDYARNHGLDMGAWGPGVSSDPIEGATRKLFETVSELSAESGLIPFAKKLPFFDKEGIEQTQVLDVLKVQMEGEYGIPFDRFNEEQRKEFLDAQVAIQTGAQNNERANAALADWSEGKTVGKTIGLVTPGGVWTKHGPRDERIALNKEADAARQEGAELTPEQANADMATQQINAGDPTVAEARTDQDMYGTVGGGRGSRGQQIVKNWNLLANGDLEELEKATPGGWVRLANGTVVDHAEFVTLSEDERTAAADAYLDKNNYRGIYDRVRDQQGEFKDEHPVYKGYGEWKNLVDDLYDGDVKAFREAMMAASPGYRTYIGRLRTEVKNDPERLNQESTDMAGYLATRGSKNSVYDEGLPQNNEAWANTDILLRAIDGGGGKAKAKYDLDTPEGQLASLKDKLSTYDKDMAAYNAAAMQETNGVPFESLPPQFQETTQGILERKGIKRPGTPEIVSAYNMWRMAQSDPSKATPEAYIAWLTEMKKKAA